MVKHIEVGFMKLSEHAILPTKAHVTDSGFDLYAAQDVIIEPGETAVIKTDIAVVLPEGCEAQVRPRSGVTSKTKLRVQLGTIDNAYRGNIGIIVDNIEQPEYHVEDEVVHEDKNGLYYLLDGRFEVEEDSMERVKVGTYKIQKGDKLAQLVVQQLPTTVAKEIFELDATERGQNGFGSSGV